MERRIAWMAREDLLSNLNLSRRVYNLLRRAGYTTIQELQGTDPFLWVRPMGPEPQYEWLWGGTPLEPWIEIKEIGIQAVCQILAAIATWQTENFMWKVTHDEEVARTGPDRPHDHDDG